MKRRTWLLSALGATGALVVGWGILPPRPRLGTAATMLPTEGDVALNGWIKIGKDGSIILAMPRSEMGQGVHTGLAMLVAEELDAPLSLVRLEQATADKIYGNVSMLVASLPFHPLESEGRDKPAKVRMGEWMVGRWEQVGEWAGGRAAGTGWQGVAGGCMAGRGWQGGWGW